MFSGDPSVNVVHTAVFSIFKRTLKKRYQRERKIVVKSKMNKKNVLYI